VEHVRRPRAAAAGLGRRRPLTVATGAGPLIRLIADRLGESVRDLWTDEDTVEYQIDGARNVDVLQALRDDPDLAFFFLGDAGAVDYGPGVRFEVVYHLFSWKHPVWLRIRAHVNRDDPRIRTITGLWEGAMFHEREMYDMMGIVFEGNRDLRRIFMSPDYKSFPGRRDFLLPDDAADSAAAGVNPLERPETWDLSRFAPAIVGPVTATPTDRRPGDETPSATAATMAGQQQAGETDSDKSRPR
jgi:NADH-quinone oxidoreductase subunit C